MCMDKEFVKWELESSIRAVIDSQNYLDLPKVSGNYFVLRVAQRGIIYTAEKTLKAIYDSVNYLLDADYNLEYSKVINQFVKCTSDLPKDKVSTLNMVSRFNSKLYSDKTKIEDSNSKHLIFNFIGIDGESLLSLLRFLLERIVGGVNNEEGGIG